MAMASVGASVHLYLHRDTTYRPWLPGTNHCVVFRPSPQLWQLAKLILNKDIGLQQHCFFFGYWKTRCYCYGCNRSVG